MDAGRFCGMTPIPDLGKGDRPVFSVRISTTERCQCAVDCDQFDVTRMTEMIRLNREWRAGRISRCSLPKVPRISFRAGFRA